ncbi:thioesterase II family protein [Streptomyces sp. P9-A2]|uniref:thioesterase II family protein n=1 Tax=Streptomyces sp. P9-A2 TaxID=3072284 RepID=UPI002FC67BAD
MSSRHAGKSTGPPRFPFLPIPSRRITRGAPLRIPFQIGHVKLYTSFSSRGITRLATHPSRVELASTISAAEAAICRTAQPGGKLRRVPSNRFSGWIFPRDTPSASSPNIPPSSGGAFLLFQHSPAFRLVCFPGAGSTTELFAWWPDALPSSVSVTHVQYPGRAERLDDPLPRHLEELAEPVAAELTATSATDASIVLIGHGMGAYVALETAHLLHRVHPGTPYALYALAQAAPTHPGPDSGPPHEGPTSPEPGVPLATTQADIRLAAQYRARYRAGPPLKCPVTALVGTYDRDITTRHVQGWQACTTGPFTARALRCDGPGLAQSTEAIAFLLTGLGLARTGRTPSRPVTGAR